MKRRELLGAAVIGAATAAAGALAQTPAPAATQRQFYLWRRYSMNPGQSAAALDAYLKDALIPAANALGVRPIGVFNAWFAPTDALGKYLLLPASSAELLATLDVRMAQNADYRRTAEAFLAAPVDKPPFARMESTLLQAMERFPGIKMPTAMVGNPNRIFEFRTYEQPTEQAHLRKIDMFENGEDVILSKVGFTSILYARNLVGQRLPALSYMWVYDSLEQRQKAEVGWGASKEREALFADPRFAGSSSMFGNYILRPTAYSQI